MTANYREWILILISLLFIFNEAVLAFRSSRSLDRKTYCHRLSLSAERQVWNPFRFVDQSSKFIPLPFAERKDRTIQPGEVLWSPSSSLNEFKFAPLDDVVMGGVSSSSFDDATGMWSGTVTDANNGGFIGIRSYPYLNWNLSRCNGFLVKLKSITDSRIKVGLRDTTEFNGIVWNASINLNKSQVIRIPFATLIPNKFANRITTNEPFNRSNIVGIQFVYSKFEYDGDLNPKFRTGDVKFQILELSSY
jgi:Complex I intermediate-associated protein 30 (CIA30)